MPVADTEFISTVSDHLKDEFYKTIQKSKRIYDAEMKPKCRERLLVGQSLENAHEKSLRVALFSFDSSMISADEMLLEKKRSLLVREISKQRQTYEDLSRAMAVDKLQSKADLSSQTYCSRIEEEKRKMEAKSCMSVEKLRVSHQRHKSKALKDYKWSNVKEPRQDYEEILKTLEEDIDSHYAYMEANFIEEKKKQEKQMKRKTGICIVVSALLFIVIASTLFFYIKRNEEIERKKAEQLVRDLEEHYVDEIYSLCMERYIQPGYLQQVHEALKLKYQRSFNDKTNYKFLKEQQRLIENLDRKFLFVERYNDDNKPGIFTQIFQALNPFASNRHMLLGNGHSHYKKRSQALLE